MSIYLGGYTQLGPATPRSLFDRVLSDILKPLLTLLYNRESAKCTISLSVTQVMWLEHHHPEVNMLIRDLVKKGRLNLAGNTCYQGIPQLLAPKDRSAQIEQSSTALRTTYGKRTGTFFCYGQIFSPPLITTLALCGIDRILINTGRNESRPFQMDELDKSVEVIPIDSKVAKAVHRFAHRRISFEQLKDCIVERIVSNRGSRMIFLNFDQLCAGQITAEQTTELFDFVIGNGVGDLLTLPVSRRKGYMKEMWYALDAVKSRSSFRESLLADEGLEYLWNRTMVLTSFARTFRKNRDLRKLLESDILKCGQGNAYVLDASGSLVRPCVRNNIYKHLARIVTNLSKQSEFSIPDEFDYDRDGYEECFYSGRHMQVLLSPRGGSVSELVYLPTYFNLAGCSALLGVYGKVDRRFPKREGELLRLFGDLLFYDHAEHKDLVLDGSQPYDLHRRIYEKREEDDQVVWERRERLLISKRYSFSNHSIRMTVTFTNREAERIDFTYATLLPMLWGEGDGISVSDQPRGGLAKLDGPDCESARQIRLNGRANITFASMEPFSFVSEYVTITRRTVLGEETIPYCFQFVPSWKLSAQPGESVTLSMVLRIEKRYRSR